MACGCGCKGAPGGCADNARPNGKEITILSGFPNPPRANPSENSNETKTLVLLAGVAVIAYALASTRS